ncbi:MAG: DUF5777 family beta-barrel protein [Bacteroidota bacterium]|nr:DUF5777 family beta-barrel protein [Bacteroidota bacterium]
MKNKRNLIAFLLITMVYPVFAQDDLMSLLQDEETVDYTYATFKSTRIIKGQSVENPAAGNLLFVISHQFGRVNSGSYEFFGLDQATIHLGLEYGITERLTVGIGRSSLKKTVDGFIKFKILRQSSGARNMPVSLSYFGNTIINGLKWVDPERNNFFSSRMQYAHQLLIARKFNNSISLQLTPTYIHRNLVPTEEDQNDVFAIGAGGRVKITQRMSVNAEYFYLLPGETADNFQNSLSLSLDIETGGHVFQLFFSNSAGMIEEYFIAETTGRWDKGDIHFGFNINRTFVIKKPKQPGDEEKW